MRLMEDDLKSFCTIMSDRTNKKYSIEATKYEYWRRLELINNETKERERITSMLNLREAYEYLRAFYKGMNYADILNIKE